MRENNIIAIPAQASATVSSAAIPAANLFAISAQAIAVGGTPGGTLKFQASNDVINPTSTASAPTNWSDIAGATVTVSAIGAVIIPKFEICYQYIRVVYTSTGSGTIQVNLKSQGA